MTTFAHYDATQPLLSLHLPKCGGNTVWFLLEQIFGDHLFQHYYDEERRTAPPRHRLGAGDCVHGHFDTHRGCSTDDYYPHIRQVVTFLRDPFLARISSYFYAKQLRREYKEIPQGPGDLSLAGGVNDFLLRLAPEREDPIAWTRYLPAGLSPETLEAWIARHAVYLGVVERMEASSRRLAQRLGVEPILELAHRNTSLHDEAVDEGLREEFRRHRPLEMALYEYALAHHDDPPPTLEGLRPPAWAPSPPPTPGAPLIHPVPALLRALVEEVTLAVALWPPTIEASVDMGSGVPYLRFTLHGGPTAVPVLLSPVTPGAPHYRRTPMFDIAYQAETLPSAQAALLRRWHASLRRWEKHAARDRLVSIRTAWEEISAVQDPRLLGTSPETTAMPAPGPTTRRDPNGGGGHP